MSQIIGWVIIPEFLSNEDDKIILTHDQSNTLMERLVSIAEGRIAIAFPSSHNGYQALFFGDFSNHLEHGLQAFEELSKILCENESYVQAEITLTDTQTDVFRAIRIGPIP